MKVLHYPHLDTVIMVKDTIRKLRTNPSRMQLWNKLPRKVQYQTFALILEYLEKSGKITFSNDGKIIWIAGSPKLDLAIRRGKEY